VFWAWVSEGCKVKKQGSRSKGGKREVLKQIKTLQLGDLVEVFWHDESKGEARIDQQRVKSKRGFRISCSLLYVIALMEGIQRIREMNLEDVEKWCQKHKI